MSLFNKCTCLFLGDIEKKCQVNSTGMGPSIKYVTLFLANFDPPLPVTLCHTFRDPPKVRHTSRTPQFLVHLVQKIRTKAPCTNSLSIVRGGFCPGVLSEGLLSGRFCPGSFCPFPLLAEYICYNSKLNITLNFMFHMYDKNMYKCDVTSSIPPSPCHKLSHLLGPSPPSSVTYFMNGPLLVQEIALPVLYALK